jgi:hypothetical protein
VISAVPAATCSRLMTSTLVERCCGMRMQGVSRRLIGMPMCFTSRPATEELDRVLTITLAIRCVKTVAATGRSLRKPGRT